MERFFILDKFNTYYDWRLILTAKDVAPPEPKTKYVEIDGMSGTLDLTESLTGETTYKDRTITATFWTNEGSRKDRADLIKKIVSTLHGKKIKIIEPDDPDHYFYGRVKIKSIKNTLPYAEFTLEATCDPWRYSIEDITRRIEVTNASNPKNRCKVILSNNGVKTVCPDIKVGGTVFLLYNGFYTSLYGDVGDYKISDIKLRQGVNIIEVFGSGWISFSYREADL